MALTIGDNFSYLGAKPLDGRLKYDTISAMVGMSESTLYDGIMVYCVEDGKEYQWKSTNTSDPTLGKWREFKTDVPTAYTGTPEMDGTGAAGSSMSWAKGDHVHPSDTSKADMTDLAPAFDDTATYAIGDRVTYNGNLYRFTAAHTGAWDAADVTAVDVDGEIPEALTAAQMQAIKDAFEPTVRPDMMPVLFDETGAERVVGWYKLANGTKKPVYEKWFTGLSISMTWASEKITTGTWINMPSYFEKIFNARILKVGTGWCSPIAIRADVNAVHSVEDGTITDLLICYSKTTDTPV